MYSFRNPPRFMSFRTPLKRDVPRQPGASDQAHHKAAKWANFGPVVVDLGPLGKGADGNRAGINGMDFAQARPAPSSAASSHSTTCLRPRCTLAGASISPRRTTRAAGVRALVVPHL